MTLWGCSISFIAILAAGSGFSAEAARDQPLALHPDNPRYFLFRGKSAVLLLHALFLGTEPLRNTCDRDRTPDSLPDCRRPTC